MISIIRKDGNDPFPNFSCIEDAVRFKRERELDKEWVFEFENGGPHDYRDQLFCAAQIIHDELRPKLRQANYDKLLSGKLKDLYRDVCDGYGPIAALYAGKMLNMAGHFGWTAREGTYETNAGPVRHGWLQHDNGTIMDVACGHLYRTPIMIIDADDAECQRRYMSNCAIEPTPARLERMKPGDGMIPALQDLTLYNWLDDPVKSTPLYGKPQVDPFDASDIDLDQIMRPSESELSLG